MISSVTVFCGSSDAVEEKYFAAARELGEKLARRRWRLVYGGGSVGLMGVLSRAVLAHGGHVTGVIPKVLLDLGVGNRGVSELIVTDGLRDRKAVMDERGDAFVALPGGLGTLEEVLEALTLKQLGYHTKPVAVLDLHGFYEPLWTQIRLNLGAFMQDLFRQGAFQGKSPREAYFVKCDNETTTQNDVNLGIVNILVGFAPLKPAEFVILSIQQMAGQIET